LGGGANAYVNYSAWQAGDISTADYAKSIVVGAGIGALSAFAPGILGGTIVGSLASATNNIYNQSIRKSTCSINYDSAKSSLITGAVSGFFGAAGAKAGNYFYNPAKNARGILPRISRYATTGKGTPSHTYQTPGGVIGMFTGTIVDNQ
jgi:hypothetical protein